jgi:5-methyltetrahydrofolate--homocysteine methyltransferase
MLSEQEHLERIRQVIIEGDAQTAEQVAGEALAAGLDAIAIIDDGLMPGVRVVGERFETGEFFLPELMMTGHALQAAMAILAPVLQTQYASSVAEARKTGVVVMATVQTDIHDIGKNLVSLMLIGAGFEVVDLGVDVPLKTIVAKAKEANADIIGCSALLTTSMPYMKDLIDLLVAMGERERFKVMVGGASVTPEFAIRIGADGTAPNAVAAAQLARHLIQRSRRQREI